MSDIMIQEMFMIQRNGLILVHHVFDEKLWERMPLTFGKTGIEIINLRGLS
jgi:hypothetical protein